jgi:hypothetical protein
MNKFLSATLSFISESGKMLPWILTCSTPSFIISDNLKKEFRKKKILREKKEGELCIVFYNFKKLLGKKKAPFKIQIILLLNKMKLLWKNLIKIKRRQKKDFLMKIENYNQIMHIN